MRNIFFKLITFIICFFLILTSVKNEFKWTQSSYLKLYLASYIKNPVILYKLAEEQEKIDEYNSSLILIELAIGLLEKKCVPISVINPYLIKKDELIQRIR